MWRLWQFVAIIETRPLVEAMVILDFYVCIYYFLFNKTIVDVVTYNICNCTQVHPSVIRGDPVMF